MNIQKLFLCPPRYLDLKYSINPWTDVSRTFSREKAQEQWQNLIDVYEKIIPGQVEIIPPKEGLTELCFFGDSVFTWKDKAVFSRFKHAERALEVEYAKEILKKWGIDGQRVPEGIEYEGSGETMVWRDKILVGHGQRSSAKIEPFLAEYFGAEVIGFEHVDPYFFHLDTALFPISDDLVAVYTDAFSERSKENITKLDCEILFLEREDTLQFALNSVALGKDIVVHEGVQNFQEMLRERGFIVHSVDISEFLKFGGGIKCLTLQHYL